MGRAFEIRDDEQVTGVTFADGVTEISERGRSLAARASPPSASSRARPS
jgi:hypothetical protein